MFPNKSGYHKTSNDNAHDNGLRKATAMSADKQKASSRSPLPSSSRHRTLEHYFQRKPSQQQDPTTPTRTLSESNRQHVHPSSSTRQPPPKPPQWMNKVAAPTNRASPSIQLNQKIEQGQRKRREDWSDNDDDDINSAGPSDSRTIVVRRPQASQSKPASKPSSLISHRKPERKTLAINSRNVAIPSRPLGKGNMGQNVEDTSSGEDMGFDESESEIDKGEDEIQDSSGEDQAPAQVQYTATDGDGLQVQDHSNNRKDIVRKRAAAVESIESNDSDEFEDAVDVVQMDIEYLDSSEKEEDTRMSDLQEQKTTKTQQEASSSTSEEEDERKILLATPKSSQRISNMIVDITPRRSMANPHLLEEDPDELEREEEEAKQEIIREVLTKKAEINARRNFDIIVTTPTYEEVCDHLYNPDEWEAVAIDSRWTGEDGHATYTIVYKDGHMRTVESDEIEDHIDPQILEDFENDLFAREENPETWYYPSFKAPGGAFAGGTSITSGASKRKGRRSDAKIFLDNCYRLGMPEELNIPMTDSSEFDSDEEFTKGSNSRIDPSQYDKFDITDAEILATIRENSSDNESWGEDRKPKRRRPRGGRGGRVSSIVKSAPSDTSRGRGRPRLIPTRGGSTPRRARGSNVVKASATSRGRGRPRGTKSFERIETSASNSSREETPLVVITRTPVKTPPSRGRPKGSKNHLKPIPSDISESSLSDLSSREHQQPQTKISVASEPLLSPTPKSNPKPTFKPTVKPTFKPISKSSPSKPVKKDQIGDSITVKHPKLKPTRMPKLPWTPSGARGPGRPPGPRRPNPPPVEEADLIEQTIRTAGAYIPSHTRTLSQTSQIESARPKKRRRIRFGRDGPEEVTDNDTPQRKRPTSQSHQQHKSPNSKQKRQSMDNDIYQLDIKQIINKMLLDGSPAYHVQLNNPNKDTIWVRLEDLKSKDAKQKVKAFEAVLREREAVSRQLYDSISAQLQLERDKQRLAEREAQILGKKAGTKAGAITASQEEEWEDREREIQRKKENAAKRLAMQETLFAGT
ncbi:hypothetical protein TWF694_011199 [Orbilia ellipsospora]|uniref:Uncharacterized protein n=1 Tax=Orbilia ellipsospora TaxID=2528407 RepID=A0AAV9XAZ3_9PEZI